MAIPTYDQLVSSPGAIGGGGVQMTQPPDVVGTDAMQMGEGLNALGQTMNQVAQRQQYYSYLNREADKKTVLDSSINNVNLFNIDFQTSLREEQGINAIGATGRYGDASKRWIEENRANVPPEMLDEWEASVQAQFVQGAGIVSVYEANEKQRYQKEQYVARVETTAQRIANEDFKLEDGQYTDYGEIDENVKDLALLIVTRGVQSGDSKEVIDRNIEKVVSDIYETRLTRMLDTSAQDAPAYWARVQDFITDPADRKRLEDLVDVSADQTHVDQVLNTLFVGYAQDEQDVSSINKNEEKERIRKMFSDPEQRQYALNQFDFRLSDLNAAQKEVEQKIVKTAWAELANDPDISKMTPSVAGALRQRYPQTWIQMQKWSKDSLKPAPITSDRNTLSLITELITVAPDEFKALDLMAFNNALSQKDFLFFTKKQLELRQATDGGQSVITPMAQSSAYATANGLDKENTAVFMTQSALHIDEMTRQLKRNMTSVEINEVHRRLMEEVITDRGFVYDTTMKRFQARDQGVLEVGPEKANYLLAVPTADIAQIRAAYLNKYGRQPYVNEILSIYNAQRGIE